MNVSTPIIYHGWKSQIHYQLVRKFQKNCYIKLTYTIHRKRPLRLEGVDRNQIIRAVQMHKVAVTLHTEGVDRNAHQHSDHFQR